MAADSDKPTPAPPPPLVAVVSWLVPGSGYLLLGEVARGATIGAVVLGLFAAGLLIGGIRVVDVPGIDADTGQKVQYRFVDDRGREVRKQWIMTAAPLTEIRNKPWSLPQAMVGPAAVAAGWASVAAIGPDPLKPRGAVTHSRVNEIGQLYLSVAGILNLLAIIDATHRAGRRRDPAVAGTGPAGNGTAETDTAGNGTAGNGLAAGQVAA